MEIPTCAKVCWILCVLSLPSPTRSLEDLTQLFLGGADSMSMTSLNHHRYDFMTHVPTVQQPDADEWEIDRANVDDTFNVDAADVDKGDVEGKSQDLWQVIVQNEDGSEVAEDELGLTKEMWRTLENVVKTNRNTTEFSIGNVSFVVEVVGADEAEEMEDDYDPVMWEILEEFQDKRASVEEEMEEKIHKLLQDVLSALEHLNKTLTPLCLGVGGSGPQIDKLLKYLMSHPCQRRRLTSEGGGGFRHGRMRRFPPLQAKDDMDMFIEVQNGKPVVKFQLRSDKEDKQAKRIRLPTSGVDSKGPRQWWDSEDVASLFLSENHSGVDSESPKNVSSADLRGRDTWTAPMPKSWIPPPEPKSQPPSFTDDRQNKYVEIDAAKVILDRPSYSLQSVPPRDGRQGFEQGLAQEPPPWHVFHPVHGDMEFVLGHSDVRPPPQAPFFPHFSHHAAAMTQQQALLNSPQMESVPLEKNVPGQTWMQMESVPLEKNVPGQTWMLQPKVDRQGQYMLQREFPPQEASVDSLANAWHQSRLQRGEMEREEVAEDLPPPDLPREVDPANIFHWRMKVKPLPVEESKNVVKSTSEEDHMEEDLPRPPFQGKESFRPFQPLHEYGKYYPGPGRPYPVPPPDLRYLKREKLLTRRFGPSNSTTSTLRATNYAENGSGNLKIPDPATVVEVTRKSKRQLLLNVTGAFLIGFASVFLSGYLLLCVIVMCRYCRKYPPVPVTPTMAMACSEVRNSEETQTYPLPEAVLPTTVVQVAATRHGDFARGHALSR